MGLGATDQQRSLFLKGFKLSKQGNFEDPTYLGFKVVFDFGTLPLGTEDGLPPSPLLKQQNYASDTGFNTLVGTNPFGQAQYDYKKPNPDGPVAFYSAAGYLREREAQYALGGKRADMLLQFQNTLKDVVNNSPWFFQSITGLDALSKVARGDYPDTSDSTFSPQRTQGKVLEFKTLEALNLRMTALATLYNQATFDYDNMRELVPRNLRRFTMYIFVSEIRNFFKTSRLVGASTALQTIDNLSAMLGSGNNPGSNIGVASTVAGEQNKEYSSESSNTNPASGFNSFVGNVLNQSGLDNDFSLLRNQQDQSGIKPVIVFECKNCEFDFSDSTPIQNTISQGSETPSITTQGFKIHVGKVRMRSQFPNIRQDGKPLILADSWDGARSSVQANPRSTDDILSIGGELLTNFISNSLNDLINEGVSNLTNNIKGIDQAILGNAYSFNPSQVLSNLSYNSAQSFLDGLGNVNISAGKANLPNPQTAGLGGPPQRVYTQPKGDAYVKVPGSDLGVPQRVYPAPSGDAYAEVPGTDLGVPQRVYNAPNGDAYDQVPGADLGVPQRVYAQPNGDAYADVPGADLGVPQRVYPAPTGDEYAQVPGSDLGVPQRVYPGIADDVYAKVPGEDLGVPQRVYPGIADDVYNKVPGEDLGVPQRAYKGVKDDVYKKVPGEDLGVPERKYPPSQGKVYSEKDLKSHPAAENFQKVYPEHQSADGMKLDSKSVYPESQKVNVNGEVRDSSNAFSQKPTPVYPVDLLSQSKSRGDIGKVYPTTNGDFIVEKPLNLGNLKPPDKYNISVGGFNTPQSNFK